MAAVAVQDSRQDDDSEFDALLDDILKNPESIMSEKLTTEQLLELQKRLNPYAAVLASDGPERAVAASCTNLRESYLRRLAMTSLVGFLYRMFSEWTPPLEVRRWTPPDVVRANDPLDPTALVERLESTLAVAKMAAEAAAESKEDTRAATEADLVLPAGAERKAVDDGYAKAARSAGRAAGLAYAAAHAAHSVGVYAEKHLRPTAEAGMKYPEVKEILQKQALPPGSGEVTMPVEVAKTVIENFISHWFRFNPDIHVRSGEKNVSKAIAEQSMGLGTAFVDTQDPGCIPLNAVLANPPIPAEEHEEAVDIILANQKTLNAVATLLRDDSLIGAGLTALSNPTQFRHYLYPVPWDSEARPAAEVVPPQDTFHRWDYYTEVNYEALRTITEAIYPERVDLDWAIGIWDIFSSGGEKTIEKQFDEFCERRSEEVPSAIKLISVGKWALLADFKENRKNIQFYNKNTAVLERILERHAEDKRIGKDLMRKRVTTEKAKNIREEGPDAPGLSAYRRELAERGGDLATKGVERVISAEAMKRLEAAKGNLKAAKELELLDQLENKLAKLAAKEKTRPLTVAETRERDAALADAKLAREMLAVPEDAIQVDIFTNDGGVMSRQSMYTKAEAPNVPSDAGAGSDRK